MALRSLICFLKVLSIKKNLNKKIICFTVVFHSKILHSYSQGYFVEIIFLIINKANKAPIISATI